MDDDFRIISLNHNQACKVDPSMLTSLSRYKWRARWNAHTASFYAVTKVRANGKYIVLQMARLILALQSSEMHADHINHDTLDNRKCNLRSVTIQQNSWNQRKAKNNTSGFKGVHFEKRRGRFRASIGIDNKVLNLGYFDDAASAHQAYLQAAAQRFGSYAHSGQIS